MKNEKILLNPPRHCLSRPFWHKTPEKSAYRIMICTTQYENSRIFSPNCKKSNLKWNFYFWDRIVIPSHYSKLFLPKQVKFEMNWKKFLKSDIVYKDGAPSKNMSKHVITSRDMLCFESREAEMWCFICRFLSSFLSRPWLLVCLKDPVWFSTGTLPPRFCTWIPPKPPITPGLIRGSPILTPS